MLTLSTPALWMKLTKSSRTTSWPSRCSKKNRTRLTSWQMSCRRRGKTLLMLCSQLQTWRKSLQSLRKPRRSTRKRCLKRQRGTGRRTLPHQNRFSSIKTILMTKKPSFLNSMARWKYCRTITNTSRSHMTVYWTSTRQCRMKTS